MKTESTQPIPATEFLTPAGPWRVYFNHSEIEREGHTLQTADYIEAVELTREKVVEALIRQRYSVNDEYQVHREKLNGTDKGEFEQYNNFVEDCKIIATEAGVV